MSFRSPITCLTGTGLIALMFATSAIADNRVAARDIVVDGLTLDAFANKWWQWAASHTREKSPVHDRTGAQCGEGQSGSVWFLAGGYGSSSIQRRCTIPADVHLFFPIINTVSYPRAEGGMACLQARQDAARNNSELVDLIVSLDGETIAPEFAYRIVSPECFDLLGAMPARFSPPRIYPAATDGYWMMLKPLAPGTHELQFAAQYPDAHGSMLQDIFYVLEVE